MVKFIQKLKRVSELKTSKKNQEVLNEKMEVLLISQRLMEVVKPGIKIKKRVESIQGMNNPAASINAALKEVNKFFGTKSNIKQLKKIIPGFQTMEYETVKDFLSEYEKVDEEDDEEDVRKAIQEAEEEEEKEFIRQQLEEKTEGRRDPPPEEGTELKFDSPPRMSELVGQEYHFSNLKGQRYNYIGPGTNLTKRLRGASKDELKQSFFSFGTQGENTRIPINTIDLIGLEHDLNFMFDNSEWREKANQVMVERLDRLQQNVKGTESEKRNKINHIEQIKRGLDLSRLVTSNKDPYPNQSQQDKLQKTFEDLVSYFSLKGYVYEPDNWDYIRTYEGLEGKENADDLLKAIVDEIEQIPELGESETGEIPETGEVKTEEPITQTTQPTQTGNSLYELNDVHIPNASIEISKNVIPNKVAIDNQTNDLPEEDEQMIILNNFTLKGTEYDYLGNQINQITATAEEQKHESVVVRQYASSFGFPDGDTEYMYKYKTIKDLKRKRKINLKTDYNDFKFTENFKINKFSETPY